ncbi:MAG: acetamidase [Nitriliruptor sp.]|nr:MAG: acetamidase [Nitriliruptor sp.]
MHTLHHRDRRHLGWDASLAPAVEIAPGSSVELVLQDAFGGQLGPQATPADVAALDLGAANPLTGPVAVAGAEPGDTLAITIDELSVGELAWTAVIPGFGLLADEFPAPHVIVSDVGGQEVAFGGLARLPTRPFLGTIGVAPAEPGSHSVIPPRRVGGNMDCRDVRAGATLLLPVEVAGALLSAGDPHGGQGDGEVCGTAVETTAVVRLTVELRHGTAIDQPQLELAPEPVVERREGPNRRLTMGVGPDLLAGARDATRAMIELLGQHGVDPADAYALCSVAGHLRILEVVDAPNWVVGMEFDLDVLA